MAGGFFRVGFKLLPSLWDIHTNVKDPVSVVSRSNVLLPNSMWRVLTLGKQNDRWVAGDHRAIFEGNKNASALAEHSIGTGLKRLIGTMQRFWNFATISVQG